MGTGHDAPDPAAFGLGEFATTTVDLIGGPLELGGGTVGRNPLKVKRDQVRAWATIDAPLPVSAG